MNVNIHERTRLGNGMILTSSLDLLKYGSLFQPS